METVSPRNHVFAPVFTDGSSVEDPSLKTDVITERNIDFTSISHRFHIDFRRCVVHPPCLDTEGAWRAESFLFNIITTSKIPQSIYYSPIQEI